MRQMGRLFKQFCEYAREKPATGLAVYQRWHSSFNWLFPNAFDGGPLCVSNLPYSSSFFYSY